MGKVRVRYVCQQCGADSRRWFGRCVSCGEWNTCVEEQASPEEKQNRRADEWQF